MANLKFEKKLTALPGTLTADTVYFLKTSATTADLYISDSTGANALKIGGAAADDSIEPFLLMGGSDG